ncbi:MAG: Uma2 family endonuclease [Gammaproteobacteria bacterium]
MKQGITNHQAEQAMALQTEPQFMTEDEYLASEPDSEVKREYIDGRVFAMAGASLNHSRISANMLGEFRNHLKGSHCEAFMADTKVKAGQSFFYPDVVVDCTNPQGDEEFLTSPLIIVEVLSKSTRKSDTTKKLMYYINIPSVEEYVLIEQDFVAITVLRRNRDWLPEYYYLGDSVTFEAIQLTLTVEEIYDRVDNDDLNQFRQAKLEKDNE